MCVVCPVSDVRAARDRRAGLHDRADDRCVGARPCPPGCVGRVCVVGVSCVVCGVVCVCCVCCVRCVVLCCVVFCCVVV